MSVPIYRPAAVVSHEVLAEEKQIIALEGWWHVNEIYYANAFDADRMRRLEAEKRVRERERQQILRARAAEAEHAKLGCAWCSQPIVGHVAVVIALKPVHPACAKEFEEWTASSEAEPDPRNVPPVPVEQQPGRIQDDETVLWGQWVDEDTPNERYEYEPVKWADLSVYERHTVERGEDGVLRGGYPF